jgi:hypothetical protein
VARLVVRGAYALVLRHHEVSGGAEEHLVQRVAEVVHRHVLAPAPGGEQRCLVDQVGEVRADHARGDRREPVEVDAVVERRVPGMDGEDLAPAPLVRSTDRHSTIEATGPQQRRVEDVDSVGGRDHDHALEAGEAVHLREDLVQRLLPLVDAAAGPRSAPRAPDGVDLVDEDDGRRNLARFRKEPAHAAGADADDHLDELRGGRGEEGDVRLAGHRPRQERLPRSRRAFEQDAAGDRGAEPAIAPRITEHVDEFPQLVLHLVDPGDVVEGDARSRVGVVEARPRPAEREPAAREQAAEEHDVEADEDQDRQDAEYEAEQERALRLGRRGVHRHSLLEQLADEVVVREGGSCGGELAHGIGAVGHPHGPLERAFDGEAAREDPFDIAGFELVDEHVVGHGHAVVLRGEEHVHDPDVEQEQHGEDDPAPRPPPLGRLPPTLLGQALGAPGSHAVVDGVAVASSRRAALDVILLHRLIVAHASAGGHDLDRRRGAILGPWRS